MNFNKLTVLSRRTKDTIRTKSIEVFEFPSFFQGGARGGRGRQLTTPNPSLKKGGEYNNHNHSLAIMYPNRRLTWDALIIKTLKYATDALYLDLLVDSIS